MNRFLISLRSLDDPGSMDTDAQHFSRFSAPRFRVPESIFGNIGEELTHGTNPADEEVDEDGNISSSVPDADQNCEEPVA